MTTGNKTLTMGESGGPAQRNERISKLYFKQDGAADPECLHQHSIILVVCFAGYNKNRLLLGLGLTTNEWGKQTNVFISQLDKVGAQCFIPRVLLVAHENIYNGSK